MEVSDYAVRKYLESKSASDAIPPDHLRVRVHGSGYPIGFLVAGKVVALDVWLALQEAGADIGPAPRVLDFGCGCGRVAGWFKLLYPFSTFHGTDIDPEAILWSNDHLSNIGTFGVNQYLPPMIYQSQFFDFVFSISIFTHLPESMQLEWLAELSRVTKKGCYLALSVHPPYLLDKYENVPEIARVELRQRGFYYQTLTQTQGLPDFYQTAYHGEQYIRREWGKFFDIVAIIPKGVGDYQDLVICRNK